MSCSPGATVTAGSNTANMLLMTLLQLLLWQLILLLLLLSLLFLPLTLLKCADNLALAALHLLHPQLLHLPPCYTCAARQVGLPCCLVVPCLVSIYTAEDSPQCLTL